MGLYHKQYFQTLFYKMYLDDIFQMEKYTKATMKQLKREKVLLSSDESKK